MTTCSHEAADHLIYAHCEQLRCIDCGAWLPLGPANDRGVPAVGMRLAALIAGAGFLRWADDEDGLAAWFAAANARRGRRAGR